MAEYAITYHGNGGDGIPENQIKVSGIDLILADATPTKTGHNFGGWSLHNNTVADYQPGDRYTTDLAADLYAIWHPQFRGIYFDANGGTDAPENQVKIYGVDLILTTDKPTRAGYNFKGWSATTRTGPVDYLPGDTYSEEVSRYLYAIWEEKQTGLLVPGQDYSGTKLHLSIPSGTVTSSKVIAKASFTNQIREQIIDGVSTGIIQSLINGEFVNTVFYRTGSDPVNLSNLTLPEGFGTILEVDDTAVLYPYIKREIHQKNYVISEDMKFSEGVTKDQFEEFKKLLPEKLKIQHGITDSVSIGLSNYVEVKIEFNPSFSKTPSVFPVLYSTLESVNPLFWDVSVVVSQITASYAYIRIIKQPSNYGASARIMWIAISEE